ncbi:MAG: hypothetical protein ACI8RZ_002276 [Myxococcota bacterium]
MTRAVAFADPDVADLINRRFVAVRVALWHRGPATVSDVDRVRLDALGFVATDRLPRVPDILVLDADLKLVGRTWSFADADAVLAFLSAAVGEEPRRTALGTDPAGESLRALWAAPASLQEVTEWHTQHSTSHPHLAPVAALLHGEALARDGQVAASQAIFESILVQWPDSPVAHRARFHGLNFDIWPVQPLPEVRSSTPPPTPRWVGDLQSRAPRVLTEPDVVVCPRGMAFRSIPAGRFTMGTDEPRFPREGPARSVVISRPYFIGAWPVTRAVWMQFEPDRWPGLTADSPEAWCPALGVSLVDCLRLINHLNRQGDWRYRLPTEAEWARAAAGDVDTRFPWGDEADPDLCNLHRAEPVPVACYPPNGFGLYDVIGNGLEWVADVFIEDALARMEDGAVDPFVDDNHPGVLQRGLRVQRSMFPAPRRLLSLLGDRFSRTYGLEDQSFGGRGLRLVGIPPE